MSRRHRLIQYRLCLPHSAIRVSSGPLLDVVDDGVDDGVEVVEVVDDLVVVVVVVDDDLGVDLDLDDDLHVVSPSNSSRRLPPASVWRNRLRAILLYITRDEVSTAKET